MNSNQADFGVPNEITSDERLILVEGGQIAMSRQLSSLDTRLSNIERMLVRLLETLSQFTAFWMRPPVNPGGGPTRLQ